MVSIVKEENTNEGITLIALVITIIILLILAGVAIATLTGENGVLTKARTAKNKTTEEEAREKVQIAVIGSYGANGTIGINELKENLKKTEGVTGADSITKLPAKVTADGYEVTIDENGKVTVEGEKPILPNTENTKPFLPEGSEIISNSLETGIIIKDKNNNEWVWIEVPKTIYNSTTTSTDYTAIETAMQSYATDYRQSDYTDTFFSTEQHGFANETEYNNHKNNMLRSVFENGGFYIGRYETGTQTPRFSA